MSTRALKEAEGPFNPHVPGIEYGVLDTLVGYGVRRAQLAMYSVFVDALAKWNITPQRFSALVIISLNEGLTLTKLAEVLGIVRSGSVVLVDALVEMGYIDRVEVPGDRRAYGLALTRKGQKDLAKITQAVLDQEARATARLNAARRKQLLEMLDLLAQPPQD